MWRGVDELLHDSNDDSTNIACATSQLSLGIHAYGNNKQLDCNQYNLIKTRHRPRVSLPRRGRRHTPE